MKTKVLSIVLVTVMFAASSFAQKPIHKNENGKRIAMVQKFKQRQNRSDNNFSFLNEGQKESMKQIRLEGAKVLKPFKNELRELHARQITLTTAETADMNAINLNIEKMGKIKTEIAKYHAKQHQEVRSLLTEEQLLKFDLMKGRKQNSQNFREHHSKRRI